MNNQQTPTVIFLRVTDNQTKIQRLGATVQQHFERGNRILILVPNENAATFVNDLLWKQPKESFLPHAKSSEECQDRIVITTNQENLNDATIAINLCEDTITNREKFERIYELLDQTTASKEQQSRQKIAKYEQSGLEVKF
ncbi:MAG: hypothetical protein K940chlam7_00855 [Chlamydiae bacterium]|nr:hypothetical protein [Chlamydiota bacterium]